MRRGLQTFRTVCYYRKARVRDSGHKSLLSDAVPRIVQSTSHDHTLNVICRTPSQHAYHMIVHTCRKCLFYTIVATCRSHHITQICMLHVKKLYFFFLYEVGWYIANYTNAYIIECLVCKITSYTRCLR